MADKWPAGDRRVLEISIDAANLDDLVDVSEESVSQERAARWADASLANNVGCFTHTGCSSCKLAANLTLIRHQAHE